MKLGELKSLGHNIADSLASGVGLLIGVYMTDIFFEASASEEGFILVDFIEGTSTGSKATPSLQQAIALYRAALPGLCEKQGLDINLISTLTARYGVDAVYGPHFTVTVASTDGKRSSDRYLGFPGEGDNGSQSKAASRRLGHALTLQVTSSRAGWPSIGDSSVATAPCPYNPCHEAATCQPQARCLAS